MLSMLWLPVVLQICWLYLYTCACVITGELFAVLLSVQILVSQPRGHRLSLLPHTELQTCL